MHCSVDWAKQSNKIGANRGNPPLTSGGGGGQGVATGAGRLHMRSVGEGVGVWAGTC